MTVHVEVRNALLALAGGRIYPTIAEEDAPTPYVVYQVVGGPGQNFLTGEKPNKQKRRVQISVWSKTTLEAAQVADQVEAALRAATGLQTEVLTVPIDTYDETTRYRGTVQEFYVFC